MFVVGAFTGTFWPIAPENEHDKVRRCPRSKYRATTTYVCCNHTPPMARTSPHCPRTSKVRTFFDLLPDTAPPA